MDPTFSLHETVSSVELMDPKMDSGMNFANVKGLADSERLGILPKATDLSLEHIIHIMDKLVAAEILHFQGHTLIQTLFSCLYLHDPERLLSGNETLLYYVLSLLRRIHIIRESIVLADNYEEEDFIYYPFGYSFCLELSHADLIKKTEEHISQLDKNENKTELENAVLSRLRFCNYITLAHMIMEKKDKSEMDKAKLLFEAAATELEEMKKTGHLGVAPTGDASHIFEPELCRLAIHTSCPRPINWYGPEECFSIYSTMISHYLEVFNIHTIGPSLVDLEKKFTDLIKRGAQLPVRSRFLLTTFSDRKVLGKYSGEELCCHDAVKVYSIPESVFKNSEKITNIHLNRMISPVVSFFKAVGSNPARRRRKLRKVLADWSLLIQDGDGLDIQLNIASRRSKEDSCHYFALWQVDLSFRLVLDYLFVGFQLDIYEDYEYPLIFWYIDNVSSTRFQNYSAHLAQIERLKQKSLAQRRKKNTKDKRSQETSKPPVTAYYLELEAKFLLYRGVYKFLAALDWFKKIKYPSFNLSTHQTRYFSRFAGLLSIELLPTFKYSNFQKTYIDVLKKPTIKGKVLLDGAVDSFKKAQEPLKLWLNFDPKPSDSTIDEIKALMRVGIMNAVQAQKLDLENPNAKVHLDFSLHHQLPIVSIK